MICGRIRSSSGDVKGSSSRCIIAGMSASATRCLAGSSSVMKRYISVFDTGFTPGLIFGATHIVVHCTSGSRGSTARHTDWPMKRGCRSVREQSRANRGKQPVGADHEVVVARRPSVNVTSTLSAPASIVANVSPSAHVHSCGAGSLGEDAGEHRPHDGAGAGYFGPRHARRWNLRNQLAVRGVNLGAVSCPSPWRGRRP